MLFEYYEEDFGSESINILENKYGVQVHFDSSPELRISAKHTSIAAIEYPSNCGMIIMYDFWPLSSEELQKCISCLLEMAEIDNYTRVIATTNNSQEMSVDAMEKIGFKKHRAWKARRTNSIITEWYYTIK